MSYLVIAAVDKWDSLGFAAKLKNGISTGSLS